jgi:hypothetical protein
VNESTRDLERRLAELRSTAGWPTTPDLTSTVLVRLRAPAPAPPRRRSRARLLPPGGFRRSLVIAVAGMLVLAGGVFAAVPDVRDAVLELFGLQGATVERREQLPPGPQAPGPLRLGERTTLEAARAQVGFEPLVPRAAGRPDAVFVDDRAPGGALSLTYRPRAGLPEANTTRLGLLVTEFRGDLAPEYLGKVASQATQVARLQVDGERAIWMAGAPHFFFYRDADGNFVDDELRLAQNVLLLEQGNLLVRLEGAFGRERALELARSLEPAG